MGGCGGQMMMGRGKMTTSPGETLTSNPCAPAVAAPINKAENASNPVICDRIMAQPPVETRWGIPLPL